MENEADTIVAYNSYYHILYKTDIRNIKIYDITTNDLFFYSCKYI